MPSQFQTVGSTPSGQPIPAILFDLNTGKTQKVAYNLLAQDKTYRFPQEGEGNTTTTGTDGVPVEYVLLHGGSNGGSNSGGGGGNNRIPTDDFDFEGIEDEGPEGPDQETVQRFESYSDEALREMMTQDPYYFDIDHIKGLARNALLLKIEISEIGHKGGL